MTRSIRLGAIIIGLAWVLMAASCSSLQPTDTEGGAVQRAQTQVSALRPEVQTGVGTQSWKDAQGAATQGTGGPAAGAAESQAVIRLGSGRFVAPSAGSAEHPAAEGDVTLNFEAADLREVVKVIFEEILKQNYLIDPDVAGVVTIHTTHPVTREAVLPILESILQSNGAALVQGEGFYKIIPMARVNQGIGSPSVGRRTARRRAGYGVQVVPLKHVSAAEIKKILEPMAVDPAMVRIDERRNLVILSGPRNNLATLLDTIEIFDVDWFSGMSFGLFPLEYSDAALLSEELTQVLGEAEGGALAGVVRLIPVERLNAILVVTHQPERVRLLQRLIDQFDRGAQAGPGRRLYVYYLRYASASDIAGTLQELFGDEDQRLPVTRPGDLPPGLRPNVRPAAEIGRAQSSIAEGVEAALAALGAPAPEAPTPPAPPAPAAGGGDTGSPAESRGPVTIKSDDRNNAILVLASPADYRAVEAAIRKLDVPPRQVLIEATIAEVQLTDNMSYGVRWFLDTVIGNVGIKTAFGSLPADVVGSDGLSLGIFNSTDELRLFFDILGTETNVKFLSAPQVLVMDNETANFRVGDQIPIVTRSSQSTTSPDAPVVSEVQYRDTGTLLRVTPRVNAGGMITLDVSQEVSNPGAAAAGANPPIAQRTIDSTVVVQSGQTVLLGGLIRENQSDTKSGIPGLMNIPVLGVMFSNTTEDTSRTELIVTLTPRVIASPMEAQQATDDLRRRVKAATAVETSIRH
jgi:general secretion pathway protein D